MRLLIDTNILIPLEPTRPEDVAPGSEMAAQLVGLAARGGHQVLIHPDSSWDLARDRDPERRDMRTILVQKYPVLERPPQLTPELVQVVGPAPHGTNDWVDDMMLAAVAAHAVNYLVTEDNGVHKKARRLGLQENVATVAEALGALRNLFDRSIVPPPSVESAPAHALNEADPIFTSIREDYPAFDAWLRKVKQEGRETWFIPGTSNDYAAVCIIKREEDRPYGLEGKVLKICTLKVAPNYRGRRFGELLLKTIFDYVQFNDYRYAYLTVFERQLELITLLEDFGFHQLPYPSSAGERVLFKSFTPASPDDQGLSALEYHIRYGPPALRLVAGRTFVVPIQPQYHRTLFPELQATQQLFDSQPHGNALRKAYLCHSIIRRLRPGDTILFYRSRDAQAIDVAAVVEQTFVSSDAEQIAALVGKRTVYSFEYIQSMVEESPVLAILFRQAKLFPQGISLSVLTEHRVLRAQPQSICTIRGEGEEWLHQRMTE